MTTATAPTHPRRRRTKDPLTETPRHRLLPPTWDTRPELAEAVKQYQRARDAHREAVTRWQETEGKLEAARAQDREATAAALLGKRKDPGTPAEDKLAEDVTTARRRLEALHEATAKAAAVVDRGFAEVREDWRTDERSARAKDEAELANLLAQASGKLAAREARTLVIRKLHPQAKPNDAGAKWSRRPDPGQLHVPPALAIEIIRVWLDEPYTGEGQHGLTSAGSQ